jgi:hypothetical protein
LGRTFFLGYVSIQTNNSESLDATPFEYRIAPESSDQKILIPKGNTLGYYIRIRLDYGFLHLEQRRSFGTEELDRLEDLPGIKNRK